MEVVQNDNINSLGLATKSEIHRDIMPHETKSAHHLENNQIPKYIKNNKCAHGKQR